MMTMRKLGKKGRFANQLFQYAYLRQESGGKYQCPAWTGQLVFKLDDPAPTVGTPELSYKFPKHSSYYNKKLFRSMFKPKRQLRMLLDDAIHEKAKGHTLVGLHLRRGDYGSFKRKSARWCFVAPVDWYLSWLRERDIKNPILFISSEDKTIQSHFSSEYENFIWDKSFYWDFYTLTQCKHLLISNSTFSFAASMLNKKAKEFYRPRLSLKKLIPYDPWNSPLIFKDELYAT